jgi:hypothetical protein
LANLHVGQRETDSLVAIGRNGHAAHDNVDFVAFERIDQLGEGISFEDDSAAEGLAHGVCEIRFDAHDLAVLLEDHGGIGARDAHAKWRTPGIAEETVLTGTGTREDSEQDECENSQTGRPDRAFLRNSVVRLAVVELFHPYPRLFAQATALQLDPPISTLRRRIKPGGEIQCPMPSQRPFCVARIECPTI